VSHFLLSTLLLLLCSDCCAPFLFCLPVINFPKYYSRTSIIDSGGRNALIDASFLVPPALAMDFAVDVAAGFTLPFGFLVCCLLHYTVYLIRFNKLI
jgi:hypothetical protein